MIGYCSNSPLRCSNAKSMTLLNRLDNSCPQCGLSLVENVSMDSSSYFEQRALQLGLIVTVLLLLVLVYIYYANFV